jgi:hypothetical protein
MLTAYLVGGLYACKLRAQDVRVQGIKKTAPDGSGAWQRWVGGLLKLS